MGKAVVSTAVGVEGLPVKDGEHVVLADSAEEFAGSIVRLLRHDEFARALAHKGKGFCAAKLQLGQGGRSLRGRLQKDSGS